MDNIWKWEKVVWGENSSPLPSPNYWERQDKLVPWLHYPYPNEWGNYFAWNTSYASTWVKTISWVGFTPTLIKITAHVAWTDSWQSDWYYYGGNVHCRYFYSTGGAIAVGSVWYSSYCQTQFSWGNASITTTITPTTDGFTINVANVWGWTLALFYECFG